MSSTLDELEAIERSARGGSSANKPKRPKGGRRGSSIFSPGGLGVGASNISKPSLAGSRGEDLLVDFPTSRGERYVDDAEDLGARPPTMSPHAASLLTVESRPVTGLSSSSLGAMMPSKRGSFTMPTAGMAGLGAFDDSDDEDGTVSSQPLPGAPLSSYAQRPSFYSDGTGVGGPNHRPLVGGFAAAAYEAARADYYQKKTSASRARQVSRGQNRSGPPPSI
mmetsp:Transcript_28062/g.43195  ORF Transcript_28062/g.43195 Transcript_28062/m.43195 type:complete len:222 (+) Transcript_28062:259-924(+)|eukprot:CAMPEP_0118693780 /NCGR_PEP_ID=MMETSP0800-20121206/12113_1 /TAXON_ID=210618 ORGANISM="Striatella unipunctata, Strain CCMP2910" /NCGR_SAMPLE_ID=MMETSP0800 /ASSEMBLY_ACC=CAM_ASM_000638 /LENGTH=221 /DNA_ID=CAMNT_0006592083 /DNA_START=241 /DNA_END=906 /DNA_ORIENTATION=+